MKCHSLLVGMLITAAISATSLAQDKASLQPNATVLSVLQGNTGKNVELRMQCGEKIGGKVEQVNDNVVLLSRLTGAEYFDRYMLHALNGGRLEDLEKFKVWDFLKGLKERGIARKIGFSFRSENCLGLPTAGRSFE